MSSNPREGASASKQNRPTVTVTVTWSGPPEAAHVGQESTADEEGR
jgi:hypothetical protein